MGRLKICLYSLLNISPRTDNSWGGNPKDQTWKTVHAKKDFKIDTEMKVPKCQRKM